MKNCTIMLALFAAFALALVASANAAVIVAENFGTGGDADLNGTSADTFDNGITTAGGSATWVAKANAFDADGDVIVGGQATGYLDMGTYINDAKGTASGLFTLSATLSPTAGFWISLGLFDSPTTGTSFTSTGLGTIIYRFSGAPGELDMWGGPGTGTGGVDGPDGQTGAQLLTSVLDLTPAGGYNGTTDYGTVTWYQGTTSGTLLGSWTYTVDNSFDAIGISQANSGGNVSGLTLSQVPEPSTFALAALGLLGLIGFGRRRKR